MEDLIYKIGLDVGSTTIKSVVLKEEEIVFKSYERHKSMAVQKTIELLFKIKQIIKNNSFTISITGSAGLGISQKGDIEFVQEVYATKIAALKYKKDVDVVIELGGEDAKILFLSGNKEVRMNGSCAGGTGAFIDQMAVLLKLTLDEFNEVALKHKKIYTIASRCGVFAKSDIQPLINQGATKSDLAASIFQAVVNQTIAGLAQGRQIKGKVMFLGGPLTFFEELKNRFKETLKLEEKNAIFPENSQYFIALGASLYSASLTEKTNIDEIIENLKKQEKKEIKTSLSPLFKTEKEYINFLKRHKKSDVKTKDINEYSGNCFLGIDAGSTTTKIVLITKDDEILYSKYLSNGGEVVSIVLNCLKEIYEKIENSKNKIKIKSATVTGYGEDLIKHAFLVDFGIVETVAHLKAARHFVPDVDFVIDIGGQDIKCFKLKYGAIDSITLNEACSSGCGSFLETFATALGYSLKDFVRKGLFAKSPVDLGSRCTVFMNSSVKQAQKDGASIEDISAGLSTSIVKNAIYKVIRAKSKEELGKKIVVQGGTFLNDAVLRAFEKELEINVTRPSISGLMGAFGCALYAKENQKESSTILNLEQLKNFSYTVKTATCFKCPNRCTLTINTFSDKQTFVSGNKCDSYKKDEKPKEIKNIVDFKYNLVTNLPKKTNKKRKIGIPLVLNMYENIPFWVPFFEELNFEVVLSDTSNKKLYEMGQYTIPSDTACYPAKLVHGHIESLLKKDVDFIFYPSMTYNFDEHISDNFYNCPIVAYYPEVIKANVKTDKKLIIDPIGLNNKKFFEKKAFEIFNKYFSITKNEIKNASNKAYEGYLKYKQKIVEYTKDAIEFANEKNKNIIVLADKPYHIDPEINHGIDKLIASFDSVVLTADSISFLTNEKVKTTILNQWSYHARLYTAANFVTKTKNANLLHIVSFGCGIDAIVSDEIKEILEKNNKLYTCIKIDEIANLGAVRIRIRSMFAAIEEAKKNKKQIKEHIYV